MKKFVLFLMVLFGVQFYVVAGASTTVGNSQKKRVAHGIINGELTRFETKKLVQQQKHIKREKRLAKADGVITRRERSHIRHDQKIANQSIYREKHDAQKRF